MSYENKQNNKFDFYSTMQPIEFNLLVVNPENKAHKVNLEYKIKNIDANILNTSYCVNVNIFSSSSVYLIKIKTS
jgi:hypothetical protein